MLHKFKPDLTLYLDEEALKQKFSEDKSGLEEIIEIQKECRDYLSTANIRRIYARMMKIEVTKMMVETVYKSLTAEEQEFVRLKYRDKKQMVAISLKLHISLAQLNIHHHAILEKTAEFMQYRLSAEDIFKREKIRNMITLLGKIIYFANRYDPIRKFISAGWLEVITERHEKYQGLLLKMEEILGTKTLHSQIIFTRMENPQMKIREIATICNVDKSIVSRVLKKFVETERLYIE